MRTFTTLLIAAFSGILLPTGVAQTTALHRQVYLGLIYYVKSADKAKFVTSNRQYSAALASHNISGALLHWDAYSDETTSTFLWLYPIEHLNDIEELSKSESELDDRIKAEAWNAGADLHYAVDHTKEFVIRDEPSLSRLPTDVEAWSHQYCEFQLYYTYGGCGGSDSEVRELWRKYLSASPPGADRPYYRILRVLIGLERPLWAIERCGDSERQIRRQRAEEAKLTGAVGAEILHTLLTFVRKSEVWPYLFDPRMSYPLNSIP